MKLIAFLLFAGTLLAPGCRTEAEHKRNSGARPEIDNASKAKSADDGAAAPTIINYGYEVVNAWPHDARAFTQGLFYHEGSLIESTGQYGESTLREVDLRTGKVIRKVDVPPQFFAEGAAILDGKVYQLTWTHGRGFIYDPRTFKKLGEFRYDGEGWGLTSDGRSLIMSDGTGEIRFLDPENFSVVRTLSVSDRGRPLRDLNELEFVRGEIFANIWHSDRIARIDPQSGVVRGWIDLAGILPAGEASGGEAVLNGIAYDETGDRLFVTGKLWPKLFEIKLIQK